MYIPDRCVNCNHHKISDTGTDYCDYIEYHDGAGIPVPYPYFFRDDYPCRGHGKIKI